MTFLRSKLINKLLVIIYLILAGTSCAEDSFREESFYLKELPGDFALGPKNAPITIIEYSALACRHCGIFHEKLFEEIKKNLIDTGKLRWVSRSFVSDSPSMRGSMLASCGDNDKYFLFQKILFAKQTSWAYSTNFEEILKNIARLSGMSEVEFNKCMDNKAISDSLTRQRMIASKVLKLEGTPAFYMNGSKIKIDSYESFEALIANKMNEIEKK